jgi:hypothetical protein
MEVRRQKPIFEMMRVGYEALFHLASPDGDYVDRRLEEFLNMTNIKSAEQIEDGVIIGIHVRHGDRHPLEFQYQKSYIPLQRYLETAQDLLHIAFNKSGPNGEEDMMAEMHSVLAVASDDPEVYESYEFSHTIRAQEEIRLAGKQSSSPQQDTSPAFIKKFVEESIGWEGGFFRDLFWSLGRPNPSIPSTSPAAAKGADAYQPPSEEAMRLRELVGRAYLLDLAVLGRSDAIVCGVSAIGCRILAVMLGWDAAIDGEAWRNVDGDFDWTGIVW